MADPTKRVRYFDGANGPYEVEVSEKDADEYAKNVGGYVLGEDGTPDQEQDNLSASGLTLPPEVETEEDVTIEAEPQSQYAPQYPAPTSQTPVYDGLQRPAGQ